jgi:replicative DNA helicase
MTKSNYLPPNHKPYARPLRELYQQAQYELAEPFPSIALTSFPKLTKMTGGLRPYEFSILCGATGTGKTTLCANISKDLTEQGIPHFIASVETGATDYVKRVMSAFIRKDWNSGEAVPHEDLNRFHQQFGPFFQSDKSWLSLYDNRVPVEALMADLAWMIKNKDAKVAIIDNLNYLTEIRAAADAVIEMDRVIHELIIFCKQMPLHLIMVMHPKKTETGRVESEFDIKGSSTAVQEAHNIFLFNRPHPEIIRADHATPNDRELLIAKMRRRGKFVRRRLILKSLDGSSYSEGEIL